MVNFRFSIGNGFQDLIAGDSSLYRSFGITPYKLPLFANPLAWNKGHPLMEIDFDLRGKTGILTRVAALLTIQIGSRLCLVDRDEKGLHRLVSKTGESNRADSVPGLL